MTDENTPEVSPEAGEQKDEEVKTPEPQVDYLAMMPEEIQNKVKEIKARGVKVFMTFLGDSGYLFRPLSVLEWAKLQRDQEQRAKAEGATEDLLQQALFEAITLAAGLGVIITNEDGKESLLPRISRENIKHQNAGVPTSLAQQVMVQSGFDNQPMTVKL